MKPNTELEATNQYPLLAKCVVRGICLGYLLHLGKSSAPLGKGCVESTW